MDDLDRSPAEIVRSFPGLRVLVIGDAMLDTYLEGTATRLCREAPVPVVVSQSEQRCPGGAANTAANVRALGAEVDFVGIIGNDPASARLRTTLNDAGVSDRSLVVDDNVTTVHKSRIIADDQYLVRFDEGDLTTCSSTARQAVLDRVEDCYSLCDLVILCDYACGTVNDEIVALLRRLRAERPRILAIDSREVHRFAQAGATILTPNLQEARAAVSLDQTLKGQEPDEIARQLRHVLDAEHIVVTMAGDGVLLIDTNGQTNRLPAYPVARAGDVGAGDSFTAATALALATGAGIAQAAQIGIDAASIACTKRRTAVVTNRELLQRVSINSVASTCGPLSLKEVATRLDAERYAGRRIVFTNGVFDILHAGHVRLLQQARQLGDVLVVGINSDASVRRLKGEQRPINGEQDRLSLIAALDAVDYTVIFTEDTPAEVIQALRPDIHVKGGDYTPETLPEIDAVREVGARVEILPLVDGLSTTNVIGRIASMASRDPAEQAI
ncbi:MAG TPA: D-glycero-beta-D-manno-heptose 1-phosphate adenylyltransferase [Thermomicrobiales bacterium]|nr:D-glycero-beta-D-manno-heptose 1-phosphate adenylyltransferase [Thermomicrobiales bacterium]